MQTFLGHGIYSFADAARLLGVSTNRVRAWFRGWSRGREAVFHTDYETETEALVISFLDLMDACVAVSLRNHGVSMPTIRRVKEELGKLWNTRHPFARQELFTDQSGRRIFLRTADQADEQLFLEILKRQHAMPDVLLPFLKRVEYSPQTQLASQMTLMEGVLINPRRRFGAPIVNESGMPTSILYEAYLANQRDVEAVADWYGVTTEDVNVAIDFESGFSGIAA